MQMFKPLRMNKSERKKLAIAYVVLIAAALLGMAVVIWLAWIRPTEERHEPIRTFDQCLAAGYPVQESYPEVCTSPDGAQFVNPDHLLN